MQTYGGKMIEAAIAYAARELWLTIEGIKDLWARVTRTKTSDK